jgi:hypothetical protein
MRPWRDSSAHDRDRQEQKRARVEELTQQLRDKYAARHLRKHGPRDRPRQRKQPQELRQDDANRQTAPEHFTRNKKQSEQQFLEEIFLRSRPELQRELLKEAPRFSRIVVRRVPLLILGTLALGTMMRLVWHAIGPYVHRASVAATHALDDASSTLRRAIVSHATLVIVLASAVLLPVLAKLLITTRLRRKLFAWAMMAAGVICFLAAWPLIEFPSSNPLPVVAIKIGGVFILIFCGLWICRAGYRRRAEIASDVLARDKRAPVLYLRPFGADSMDAYSDIHPLLSFLKFLVPKTIESWVFRPLRRVGPVIGLYPFGAGQVGPYISPISVDDEHWQECFFEALKRAQLVFFVCPIGSEGVLWELAQILERCLPTRVLLLYFTNASEFTDLLTAYNESAFPPPFDDLPKLIVSQWRYGYKMGPDGLVDKFSLASNLADSFTGGWLPVVVRFNETWEPSLTWAPTRFRDLWRGRSLNPVAAAVTLALNEMGF